MPNKHQIFLAITYGNGDYSALAKIADHDEFRRRVDAVDDLIFRGLMALLATENGCENDETARDRLQNASDDIDQVIQRFYESTPTLPAP